MGLPSAKHGSDSLTLGQTCLAGLAVLYMVTATFWSLPEGFPAKKTVDALVSPLFLRLGLWQGWDMFSPNPRSEDIYISAKAFFSDGTEQVYALSRMTDYSLARRYQRERWRKFFNDNFRLDSHRVLWPDGAVWVARRIFHKTGKMPSRVELWRHWRNCVRPGEPKPAEESKFRFYTREFQQED